MNTLNNLVRYTMSGSNSTFGYKGMNGIRGVGSQEVIAIFERGRFERCFDGLCMLSERAVACTVFPVRVIRNSKKAVVIKLSDGSSEVISTDLVREVGFNGQVVDLIDVPFVGLVCEGTIGYHVLGVIGIEHKTGNRYLFNVKKDLMILPEEFTYGKLEVRRTNDMPAYSAENPSFNKKTKDYSEHSDDEEYLPGSPSYSGMDEDEYETKKQLILEAKNLKKLLRDGKKPDAVITEVTMEQMDTWSAKELKSFGNVLRRRIAEASKIKVDEVITLDWSTVLNYKEPEKVVNEEKPFFRSFRSFPISPGDENKGIGKNDLVNYRIDDKFKGFDGQFNFNNN